MHEQVVKQQQEKKCYAKLQTSRWQNGQLLVISHLALQDQCDRQDSTRSHNHCAKVLPGFGSQLAVPTAAPRVPRFFPARCDNTSARYVPRRAHNGKDWADMKPYRPSSYASQRNLQHRSLSDAQRHSARQT